MSKRRLTKQQKNRIQESQSEELARANDFSVENCQRGILIARYGKQADILDESGQIQSCTLRPNLPPLVVGDLVAWEKKSESEAGAILALTPRKTELCRFNYNGDKKLVAANISQAIITAPVIPAVPLALLDAYLAAVELMQVKPIIVFNKTDLLNEENQETFDEQVNLYKKIGYVVLCTDGKKKESLGELERNLIGETSVFIGPSGAGKSTLIKQFVDDETIAVGEVSEGSQLGRHTTTTSYLYQLKPSGIIIDSPGVRGFGPGKISMQDLYQGFIDISPFQGECKFRDCQHESEPSCALQKAVESGALSRSRFESFKKLASGDKND